MCTYGWITLLYSKVNQRCVHAKLLPLSLFAIPWTVACQAPLCMRFFRQEYWSGLLCPPPGHLPDSGIKPMSPVSAALQVDSFPLSHWGSPFSLYASLQIFTV